MKFDVDGTPLIPLEENNIDISKCKFSIEYEWEWNPISLKWQIVDDHEIE